uniref:Uncharacterized protein n=1 Tax=Sphaerodactylus townsendi TaxID=933632 RepID=A0ACB8G8I3_9SAUR
MLKGASMENVRKVLVYLSKDNGRPQLAKFQQSIVGHFCAAPKDSLVVNCGLHRHQFLISDMEFAGSKQVLLQPLLLLGSLHSLKVHVCNLSTVVKALAYYMNGST